MDQTGSFVVPPEWGDRRIYKNLFVLSFGFLFVFTAFQALSNLQSSINCDAGLGLVSLATIYATLILSCMFAPSVIIRYMGLKWTLVISMSCYALYTVANYLPSWATLIPASALVGLAAAPLWTAMSTYVTTIGIKHAVINDERKEDTVAKFFGFFLLICQTNQIIGNLISSLVFRSKESTNINDAQVNDFTCGAQDCSTETTEENVTTYCNPPEKMLTNILLTVYLVCGITGMFIVVIFLQKFKRNEDKAEDETCGLFLATLKLMQNIYFVLMIPFSVYAGLQKAFITADFTKSYVTCTVGVEWIGYVMICYGITIALFSPFWGSLAKLTGRFVIFTTGTIIFGILIVVLLTWAPKADQLWVMFVSSGLRGVTGAAWETQMNALYGSLFPNNQQAAFSNFRLWESVGFTLAFSYSNFLCVWTKLTILATVLGTGFIGYVILETNEWRLRRESSQTDKQEQNYEAVPVSL
ncbi:Protein unc-93-like A [Holothuria leucospilota]|uniref:Protein unc-93-like A n=1 Tax=Holothuria leucospilota TaxID=206669 RepID=A0A9Q0YCN5_HOLLE|nr:Protein unc-93-like A [Holothuria leucospilota]